MSGSRSLVFALALVFSLGSLSAVADEGIPGGVDPRSVETRQSDVVVSIASCPAGKQLLGGAYQSVSSSDPANAPLSSRPALGGEQAWEVTYNIAGPAFRAVAQCGIVKG